MLITLSRRAAICQSVAVVYRQLTGMTSLGAVSHRFINLLNLQERDLYGGLGVDGRTILEWTLKK